MVNLDNFIFKGDSYKYSHFAQYPPNTTEMSSYIEARTASELVFFGLQAFLRSLKPVSMDDVEYAEELIKAHGVPFNSAGWRSLVTDHGGRLPVEIYALPEGTVVNGRVPLVQMRNLDPRFVWLASFIETALLRAVWYPSTVATISKQARDKIYEHLVYSSDDPDGEIDFKLHNFGSRGVSSSESAALGGLAHLALFKGTDTVEALIAARRFYDEPMAGYSIPAAEHSTITSWGKSREADSYRNMLTTYAGYPLVAVVSDSYDIFNACAHIWGGTLKADVVSLGDAGRTLVIRPDSGDPVRVVCAVMDILWDKFGGTLNSKGFKVLPPYLRVIQGDGVNVGSIGDILGAMNRAGFSATNISFGVGGALMQKVDRDTFGFAMKANEVVIDGNRIDVFKQPTTDGGKSSKAGRQAVVRRDGEFVSVREDALAGERNCLELVWAKGASFRNTTLTEVRNNVLRGS